MMLFQPDTGKRGADFRQFVYEGNVLKLSASDATREMVSHVWNRICEVLGDEPRAAQFQHDGDQFFQLAGQLRREFYESEVCRQVIASVLQRMDCATERHLCDPARLRVVTVGGHHNPAAAPVYYAHRDTWYSNPQQQITWWMPLHAVGLQETFEFLPNCFDRAVQNDSGGFDYGQWTSKGTSLKIGWQDPAAGRRELYPQLQESLDQERRISFTAEPGEMIVFSGQHLHQTIPIKSGLTRFSIDFRTVCLPDHEAGLGPLNVDNHSTGDALQGHVPVTCKSTS